MIRRFCHHECIEYFAGLVRRETEILGRPERSLFREALNRDAGVSLPKDTERAGSIDSLSADGNPFSDLFQFPPRFLVNCTIRALGYIQHHAAVFRHNVDQHLNELVDRLVGAPFVVKPSAEKCIGLPGALRNFRKLTALDIHKANFRDLRPAILLGINCMVRSEFFYGSIIKMCNCFQSGLCVGKLRLRLQERQS